MYKLILVPLDGSATAERGLQEAISLAIPLDAGLRLLHVIDAYPMYAEHASAAAFLQSMDVLRQQGLALLSKAAEQCKRQGVQVSSQLREGIGERAANVIVDEATKEQCDLIVLGTHGRRGMGRLLMGSDAELVLRGSSVPVLMVRVPAPDAA